MLQSCRFTVYRPFRGLPGMAHSHEWMEWLVSLNAFLRPLKLASHFGRPVSDIVLSINTLQPLLPILQRYSQSREAAKLHGVQGSIPALGLYPPFMAMGILRNNTRQMEYGPEAVNPLAL